MAIGLIGLLPTAASAQNGSWSATANGAWSTAANWTGGVIANSANNTATFATAGLTGDLAVSLDSPRTLGGLIFDNPTNSFGWSISGNSLTLSNAGTPTINVANAAITATMGSILAGTQGFNKVGPGTLSLTGFNPITGGISVSAGTLAALAPGTLGAGTVTLAGGTLSIAGHQLTVADFGGLGAGWTTNGSAAFTAANLLQLTPATGGNGSAWLTGRVAVAGATTVNPITISFTFTPGATPVGGFTVGFQNAGLTALGAANGLGYTGISPSSVLAVDLSPADTIGGVGSGYKFLAGGASPGTGFLPTAPVNLGAGQPTKVVLNYDGANTQVTMTQGANTFTSPGIPNNIVGAVGSAAYFGFTGATGGVLSQQQISSFSYTGPPSGQYSNNVVVTASSTIEIAPTALVRTITMGSLTMGGNSTLTVTADPSTPVNQPFGLTFASATVNGSSAFSVPSNGTGAGTLTISGRLSLGTNNLSLGGANLSIGSLTGSSSTLSGNGGTAAAPVVLTVGSDSTSPPAYLGVIADGTGVLALVKTGNGTLTLAGVNTYSGGTTINNGAIVVASDAALGTGSVTGSPLGTLQYAASTTTTRTFNLGFGTLSASSVATVTLNGSTVSNGYLDGAGTFATAATGGVQFANVTSEPSTTVAVNNPSDRFVNFTNGGQLNVAASLPAASTTMFSGFTNQGSGTITIGAGSKMSTSDFQSAGVLTLNPAAVGSGQRTLLTNSGSSSLNFNGGSRTFIGTPATANASGQPTFVAGIDLNGQNAVVAGGLFVNNGFVVDTSNGGNGTGTVIADFGALVKGAGFFQNSVITQNGGKFQAGNSPGASVFGNLTIGPGGINDFLWQINNAKGVDAPTPDANNDVSGWSQLQAKQVTDPLTHQVSTGNLKWTATSVPGSQFMISMETLMNPTPVGQDNPGQMDNFHSGPTAPPNSDDGDINVTWPIIKYQGTYLGPTDSATLTADTLIDMSEFQNRAYHEPFSPTFAITLDPVNKSIDVVYHGVPEPGTLVLTAAGLALAAYRRRRRVP